MQDVQSVQDTQGLQEQEEIGDMEGMEDVDEMEVLETMQDEDTATAVAQAILQLRTTNATRPALSLPFELLGPIFEIACDEAQFRHSFVYRGTDRKIRFSVISTCWHWRNVAVSTPSLWCNLHPVINLRWSVTSVRSLLELEIRRAAQRALRVVFVYHESSEVCRELLRVIRRIAPRCESICIIGRRDDDARVGLFAGERGDFSPLRLPILRALVLHFSAPNRLRPWSEPVHVPWARPLNLTRAPRLGYLSVNGSEIPVTLPYPNNVIQVSGNFTVNATLSILQRCHHLRGFQWHDRLEDSPGSPSRSRQLPQLRLPSLENMSFPSGSSGYELLPLITAPRLRILSISGSTAPTYNQFPNLELLYIYHKVRADLIPTLWSVPSIRELVIYAHSDSYQSNYGNWSWGDEDDDLYEYPWSLVNALVQRDNQGVLELVPSLRGLVMQTYSVRWAEALVNGRNGMKDGQPEECKMQFTLHLPRDNPRSEEFPAFRHRHPWSVDKENESMFSESSRDEPSLDAF